LSRLRSSAFLLAGLVLAAAGCAQGERPDVLLVVVDTLRADRLGSYGYAADTSPQLDAFAAAGVRFERALAASTLTAPSHASLMTSRWVGEHAIGTRNGTTRLDGERTLAAEFSAAGYETAAFVSNFVIRGGTGLEAGFDLYDDELPDVEANRPIYRERKAAQTAQRAIDWLGSRGERPLFLFVHFQDPHGPYAAPPPFDERFPELRIESEPALDVLPGQKGPGGIPAYQALPGETQPSAYKRRYAQEVAYFDAELGRLLEALRVRGRPLVAAVTADHGESLGEAGYWFQHGHASTPDLGRIPLVLQAPGLAAGRRSDLVSHVDLMPTLLELAGLPVPEDVRGIALGPYLRSGEPLPGRTLFCDVGDDVSAYKGDRFYRRRQEPGPQGAPALAGTFRWSPGVPWERVGDDPELRHAVLRYEQARRPTRPQEGSLSPADRERLRALGYLEPAEEPTR
jgi:arylsulfatase A-like enzyme